MTAVHINQSVLETLASCEKTFFGVLLGQESKNGWNVTGCCCFQDSNPKEFSAQKDSALQYLAGGLLVCGIFLKSHSLNPDDIVSQVSNYLPYYQNGLVIIVKQPKDTTLSEDNVFVCTDQICVKKPQVFTVVTEDPQPLIKFRLRCPLTVSVQLLEQKGSLKNALSTVIDNLCNTLSSPSTVYRVKDTEVVFNSSSVVGLPEESVCSSLCDLTNSDPQEFVSGKQSRSHTQSTLQCAVLQNITVTDEINEGPVCAPIIQHNLEKFRAVSLTLPVDVCCQVTSDTMVTTLGQCMTTAICSQLRAMQDSLLQNVQGDVFPKVQVFHFQPWKSSAIISVIYPDGKSDENLESRRRALHSLFCLPMSKPVFRRGNVCLFPEDISQYGYLINPHQYITAQQMKGGQQYLVQGLYSYHHYMQDRFDDNMWGCAYRSLQTLVSWFRFQGYTDKPIPTHKEIQQALVDVGDKEPKFVGSRQWIGSMEVSYCLDHLIGVTSRIAFVSEGTELASKGRELAQHFQIQGTPVMIGGGVLAHTILGVDFNEVTGDVRFLILDPHYTGAEDLRVILDKGWCGWKGMDFWDKTAHYNMCLPQRPNVI
uniref:Ufm1-specific protease 2-like n=1 Tax=Crassostrea virginica TaxID=6565 RepID=A0A8B8DJP3_CRAVI|nr:ufm1-specific protease 2-like [Crassostrea virginica]